MLRACLPLDRPSPLPKKTPAFFGRRPPLPKKTPPPSTEDTPPPGRGGIFLRGGGGYGRLAFIWRIEYIQDLPGAARRLLDSERFEGVPVSSFQERLCTLWQRGKNI